ncbi:MAG TPA: 2'-5' RNA ligase family protein [Gemmatimonadaceae bacterium]|nr:2'-5' RNA ligase family protein [Gemmatimonadaceae bacterium]
MKPGIVVMSELHGAVADRLREIQLAHDPRMAAELPPHVTITGSSGMGPISPATTDDELRAALEQVATNTASLVVRLEPPMRFMQSTVVVMPIDPNGPIRALHERIKASGLSYEQPRFTFTPHCTLSFYPQLSRDVLRELLRSRITEPVIVDSIQAYRAIDLTRTQKVLDLPLTGASAVT